MFPTTPPPEHGPLASSYWDDSAARWRLRLNLSGQCVVSGYMAQYPEPWRGPIWDDRLKLLRAMFRDGMVSREDIQSVSVRAICQSVIRYPGPLPPSPWVWAAIVFGLLNVVRRDRKREVPTTRMTDVVIDGVGRCDPEAPDTAAITAALQELPPRQREVVERYHSLNGYGGTDADGNMHGVARAMGLPETTVRREYERGIGKLRRTLGGDNGG